MAQRFDVPARRLLGAWLVAAVELATTASLCASGDAVVGERAVFDAVNGLRLLPAEHDAPAARRRRPHG